MLNKSTTYDKKNDDKKKGFERQNKTGNQKQLKGLMKEIFLI